MKSTHRKYDTFIVWLFIHNKEYLLDEKFRKSIPNSTIHGWRNSNYSDYYGSEYASKLNFSFEVCSLLMEIERLKKLIFSFRQIWGKISPICIETFRKSKDLKIKGMWLDQTQLLVSLIGKKRGLQLMGYTPQSYDYHIKEMIRCLLSPIENCYIKFSSQLRREEVAAIRELFNDPHKKSWSKISLYYYGLNNQLFSMAISTFYKYCRLLGFENYKKPQNDYDGGLKAEHPNQYIHVDTTFYKKLTDVKQGVVTFASDNFSRMITGFVISTTKTRLNVSRCLGQTVDKILELHPNYNQLTTIICDRGSENNNQLVEEYIKGNRRPLLRKLIAQEDIKESNSPIEAVNKIFKRYLRFLKPTTYNEFIKAVEFFVEDYNYLRPHGSLKGLTPFEAYTNKEAPTEQYRKQIKQAYHTRIQFNRMNGCGKCCK